MTARNADLQAEAAHRCESLIGAAKGLVDDGRSNEARDLLTQAADTAWAVEDAWRFGRLQAEIVLTQVSAGDLPAAMRHALLLAQDDARYDRPGARMLRYIAVRLAESGSVSLAVATAAGIPDAFVREDALGEIAGRQLAHDDAKGALDTCLRIGTADGRVRALGELVDQAVRAGHSSFARLALNRAEPDVTRVRADWSFTWVLLTLAKCHVLVGNDAQALAHLDRVRRAARSREDAEALVDVASLQAALGALDDVTATLRRMPTGEARDRATASTVPAFCAAGRLADALDLAGGMADRGRRREALRRILQPSLGRDAEARIVRSLADEIADVPDRVLTLCSVASWWAERDRRDHARQLLEQALSDAATVRGPDHRVEMLRHLAVAQGHAGDVDRARSTLTLAVHEARRIVDRHLRDSAYAEIARAQLAAGASDAAWTTAGVIDGEWDRDRVWDELVVAELDAEGPDRAAAALTLIPAASRRRETIIEVATAFVSRARLSDALDLVGADPASLVELAEWHEGFGDVEIAREILRTAVLTREYGTEALCLIAETQSSLGDVDACRATVARLPGDGERDGATLIRIGRLRTAIGDLQGAAESYRLAARRAIEESRTSYDAGASLQAVVRAQIDAGSLDEAAITAGMIEDPMPACEAQCILAQAREAAGDAGGTRAALTRAFEAAAAYRDCPWRDERLRQIVMRRPLAVDVRRLSALSPFDQAAAAATLTGEERVQATAVLVHTLSTPDERHDAWAFAAIGDCLAGSGDDGPARDAYRKALAAIDDRQPERTVELLARLADGFDRFRDVEGRDEAGRRALAMVVDKLGGFERDRSLDRLSRQAATFHRWPEAVRVADLISTRMGRHRCLRDAARKLDAAALPPDSAGAHLVRERVAAEARATDALVEDWNKARRVVGWRHQL